MELRPCSAYTVPHYMTHQSRPQISIKSCIVSTTSYRMEQVLCQPSLRDLGNGQRASSAKANRLVYVIYLNRGPPPLIIGSKRADERPPLASWLSAMSCYPTFFLEVSMAVVPGVVD